MNDTAPMGWRERRRWRRLAKAWAREAVRWDREDITAEINILACLKVLDPQFHRAYRDAYLIETFRLAGTSRRAADAALDLFLHAAVRYSNERTKE